MDQDVVMDDISNKIKNAGVNMRKALDTADIKKGLKYANAMLIELKTSSISPRNYYNLCTPIQ
jgi:vacuolar protein sorting-associated protein 35